MDEQAKHEELDALFRMKGKKGGYRIVEPPAPSLEAPVADTHAHLGMLGDPGLSLARCAVHGVSFICAIADPAEDERAYDHLDAWRARAATLLPQVAASMQATDERQLNEQADIPHVRLAIGCHPHNARHYDEAMEARLIERARDPRTCAIGEIGLDYHYDFSPREVQRDVFRRQIRICHETQLPLVLHLREAHDEAYAILEEEGFPEAGVLLHCFNLGIEELEPWLAKGAQAAFGGAVTFKRSEDTRHAVSVMPAKAILTETDAPYMAPEPMRGMKCGPEHTVFTAACIAETRECPPGEMRKALLSNMYANALELLDRQPTPWQQGGAR